MVPSTSPSTYRSSRLKIWPAILTAFPMVADPPRDVSGSILPAGMLDILDKVVPSFLTSTGGADGVGLIVFVVKGAAGSSSRRCLFQTLTTAAPLSGV